MYYTEGAKFCTNCSRPAPWVSREDRILWIQDRLEVDQLDDAAKLELRELLDRLAAADPNDQRTIASWERVKKVAPKAWAFAKPVLQSVIGDQIKQYLGL